MLGSPILYLSGHEDTDVPTFWLLLYRVVQGLYKNSSPLGTPVDPPHLLEKVKVSRASSVGCLEFVPFRY